jgi:hypothetical protein
VSRCARPIIAAPPKLTPAALRSTATASRFTDVCVCGLVATTKDNLENLDELHEAMLKVRSIGNGPTYT